ncbi:hypothetical protein N1031_19620 [Herbiconiux moechotypicola]|uniref:Type II secretion system F family protein n=1 Tax=Herbiconiux moechotypicola TaxID=637393 RepID=A0ABP5R5W1_9MICO|nr:hypothetical protein [Herbiconiux moechotypicola]MCS5731971.1 hypothetical protein [Herbiconiux moechotypicola]
MNGASVPTALDEVSAVADRVAALLAAGVSPRAAWGHLAAVEWAQPEKGSVTRSRQRERSGAGSGSGVAGNGAAIHTIAEALASGMAVPEALCAVAEEGRQGLPVRRAWRMLGVTWAVAEESGAPLAVCLRDASAAFADAASAERDRAVALAGPRATARLVTVLPLISVLGGTLIGLDTVHILIATAGGWICLVLGLGLMLAGRAWSAALLAKAAGSGDRMTTGLALDLVAVAVRGGGPLETAVDRVERQWRRLGLGGSFGVERVQGVVELARRSGAAPAELLRGEAARQRRAGVARGRADAASLAVWLMLPLGACVLPAFFVLTVVPMFLGVLGRVTG